MARRHLGQRVPKPVFFFGILAITGAAVIPMLYVHLSTVRLEATKPFDGVISRRTYTGLFGSGRNDAGLGDLPSMDFSQKQARWIVVDVTSSLCEGKQQAPHGWKTAEASETSQLKIRYTLPSEKLSLDDVFAQQVTGVTGLPVWRNLAYLTAIQGGADHVLDADCSLPLAQQIDQLHFQTEPDQGLLYNSTLLFNPYAHFGAWAVVPKALVTAGKVNNSRSYYVRDFSRVLVKHGLSDRSHDAVATHDSGHAGVDKNAAGIRFHYSSPPVFLGHRSFSAAVPWCSAYQSEAFWGLLLPCLNPSLLCHVLRLFIQQRLFRELDAFAGYYKLNTSSHRASVASFGEDLRFIHGVDVSDLASLLDTWGCEGNLTFYGCYRALADHLYSNGYLTQLERKLMKSWIDVLQRHGVEEPVRIKTTWRGVRKVGEVGVVMGNLQDRLEAGSDEDLLQVWKQAVGPVKERCANVSSSSSEEWFMHMGQWRTAPMLHDVVMIIVFNNHRYLWPNVAFLETMHRPFFRHIVYCLNRVPELLQAPEYRAWHHLVLLEGLSRGWFLMYGCVTTVIQMQLPGVRGYVMIGDDTLLNTWTVFNLPRDLVWLHPFQGRLESVARAKSKTGWQWWANSSGRCALLKAMAELELISGLTVQEIRKMIPGWNDTAQTFTEILHAATENLTCTSLPGSEDWPKPSPELARRFLWNYYHVHQMGGQAPHKATDFLYLPQTMAHDYVAASRHFMAHQVMIEVAFNVIQLGLSGEGQYRNLQAISLWGRSRRFPGTAFRPEHFYMHPFKLAHAPSQEVWKFFCDVYLKTLFSKVVWKG